MSEILLWRELLTEFSIISELTRCPLAKNNMSIERLREW